MNLFEMFNSTRKRDQLVDRAYTVSRSKLRAAEYAQALTPLIEYQLKHPQDLGSLLPLVDIMDEILPSHGKMVNATTLLLTLINVEDMWRKHLPKTADEDFISIHESITRTLSEIGVEAYTQSKTPEEKREWINLLINLDPHQIMPRPRQENPCLDVVKTIYNRHRDEIPAGDQQAITDYLRVYYPNFSPPAAPSGAFQPQ